MFSLVGPLELLYKKQTNLPTFLLLSDHLSLPPPSVLQCLQEAPPRPPLRPSQLTVPPMPHILAALQVKPNHLASSFLPVAPAACEGPCSIYFFTSTKIPLRVRCDLKDLPLGFVGPPPACSNCKERGIKCVLVCKLIALSYCSEVFLISDEFADVKAVKLLRRGRRLQQVEYVEIYI